MLTMSRNLRFPQQWIKLYKYSNLQYLKNIIVWGTAQNFSIQNVLAFLKKYKKTVCTEKII